MGRTTETGDTGTTRNEPRDDSAVAAAVMLLGIGYAAASRITVDVHPVNEVFAWFWGVGMAAVGALWVVRGDRPGLRRAVLGVCAVRALHAGWWLLALRPFPLGAGRPGDWAGPAVALACAGLGAAASGTASWTGRNSRSEVAAGLGVAVVVAGAVAALILALFTIAYYNDPGL